MSRRTLARRLAEALPGPKPAEVCKHTLTHPGSASSAPRDICISTNQTKVLFNNKKPKRIACGAFACAYDGPKADTVTKITYDPSDVGSLLQAQGSQYVPKVHAAFKLKSTVKWHSEKLHRRMSPHAYGVVVERLKGLPVNIASYANCIGTKAYKLKTSLTTSTALCCEDYAVYPDEKKVCRAVGTSLVEIQHDLHKRGIQWKDIHGANLGFGKNAAGKTVLKALDLGMTNTAVQADLPELAGSKRKRRKK